MINERAVSPFGKPVIFVKELFGVRRSSILYLYNRIKVMQKEQ